MPKKKPETVKEKMNAWEGGARELDRWLYYNRTTPAELAARTGLSVESIYGYRACRRWPTILGALLIERETGIPVTAWVDPLDLKPPTPIEKQPFAGPDRKPSTTPTSDGRREWFKQQEAKP